MKGFIRDLFAFIIIAHFWTSGAITAGISVMYWFGANLFWAGVVTAGAFLLSPVVLFRLIDDEVAV